jgi:hypothetical protein
VSRHKLPDGKSLCQVVEEQLQYLKDQGLAFSDEETVWIGGYSREPDWEPVRPGYIKYITLRLSTEAIMEITRFATYQPAGQRGSAVLPSDFSQK